MAEQSHVTPLQQVHLLTRRLESISHETAVLVVANLKSSNGHVKNSLETEYFSQDEAEQIICALRELGLYVSLFNGEDQFIASVLDGSFERIPKTYKIVYNSAQAGAGPGRKSLIPAFCQLHGIATTSSDPYVVSLARNKFHVNRLLRSVGLPAPDCWSFDWRSGWMLNQRPPLGKRVIVKPTYESASIGIDSSSVLEIGNDFEDLFTERSRIFHQPLVVQEFVAGFEVEVPIIGTTPPLPLMLVGISTKDSRDMMEEILTYEMVYYDKYSFYLFEGLSVESLEQLRQSAVNAFRFMGIQGLGRIDFRVDLKGRLYITDIATNPHVTQHSSFSFALQSQGEAYRSALALLIALGCNRAGWI